MQIRLVGILPWEITERREHEAQDNGMFSFLLFSFSSSIFSFLFFIFPLATPLS